MAQARSSWNWPALLFGFLGVLILLIGCLASARRPDEALDIPIHDMYFVMPAMHVPITLALACLVIALLYLAFHRVLRRPLNSALGLAHFISSALALFVFVVPAAFFLWTTAYDAPRRYYSYTDVSMDEGTIDLSTILDTLLLIGLAGQLVFLFNIVRTLLRRKGPVS